MGRTSTAIKPFPTYNSPITIINSLIYYVIYVYEYIYLINLSRFYVDTYSRLQI
jgi:hypothetical protein